MKDLLRLMQILVQFYISINAKGKTGIICNGERLKKSEILLNLLIIKKMENYL